MAILRQSPLWPIHSARSLHSRAQLRYLWQVSFPDENGLIDRDITFLAQRISLPGVEVTRVPYSVGGEERYFLTTTRRGGIVTATFVEVEGLKVEGFFRMWMDDVDVPITEVSLETRARGAKGTGAPGEGGYVRTARVTLYRRLGLPSAEWEVHKMVPLRLGRYEFDGESGALMIPVELTCDEVRRTA